MSFLNNSDFYLYRRELKKTILCFTGILFLLSLIVLYYQAHKTNSDAIDDFKRDEELILKDLKKLALSYKRQISFTAKDLQEIKLTNSNIDQYFSSSKASVLDRSIVDGILITDTNRQIIYSDIQGFSANQNIKINNRTYFADIKDEPYKVVFGNIVEGVLTKKPAIPVATNILNSNNEIHGYIIFSVSLENIASNLINSNLFSIQLFNEPKKQDNPSPGTNTVTSFFLPLIINNNKQIEFTSYDEYSNKYVTLSYSTQPIFTEFYYNSLFSILLIAIPTGILFALYYFYVLIPMKKCISMIKTSPADGNDIINNNLFYYIRSSLYNQQLEIRNKDFKIKDQLNRLMQVILSVSSISHYVSKKLSILSEDISDNAGLFHQENDRIALLDRPLLDEALSMISDTDDEIKKTFASILDLCYILTDDKKEECCVIDIITPYLQTPEILHSEGSHPVKLYVNLFRYLVQEILAIEKYNTPLEKVFVSSDNTNIEFIFKSKGKDITAHSCNTLTICRILGAFNKTLVSVKVTPEHFILTCNINQDIEPV